MPPSPASEPSLESEPKTEHSRPAVVLLSGGLDSTTVLAMAAETGRALYALSFRYGQRHAVELACAKRQGERFGVRAHRVIDLDHLGAMVAPRSALVAGSELAVPKDGEDGGIPVTYVPARNALFLAYALAWAEVLDAEEIWLGVNAVDYSGYPDCRPAFLEAFEAMAGLATKMGIEGRGPRIVAPLMELSKAEIIARGVALGVDYADTVSCYDPLELSTREEGGGDEADESEFLELPRACGRCDSCRLRREGFLAAQQSDPTVYAGS